MEMRPHGPVRRRGPRCDETWCGHGKAPHWLTALIAADKKKGDFRIVAKPPQAARN